MYFSGKDTNTLPWMFGENKRKIQLFLIEFDDGSE